MAEGNMLNGDELDWLSAHTKSVETKIIAEARAIAKDGKIEPKDLYQAALKFIPGDRIPDEPAAPTTGDRILASISGITIISAILAVVFALLGFFLPDITGPNATSNIQLKASFIDIAKIFAGAIVGSAGAGAVSTVKRK